LSFLENGRKNMKKIALLIKTDINTDSRVINQLNLLKESGLALKIDLILLADKTPCIKLNDNVLIHEVKCTFRHNKLLRVFTALEFTLRSILLLKRLKPDIIQASDDSVVLPSLLYRLFSSSKRIFIYDDHEIPNENSNLLSRLNHSIENLLIKKADVVIFANNERLTFLQNKLKLKNRLTYFLNLPYFQNEPEINQNPQIDRKLKVLDEEISKGTYYIIHQGSLHAQRGRAKLAQFAKKMPDEFKILLLGVSDTEFQKFLSEFNLTADKFTFMGTVNHFVLPLFWDKGVASVIMYLPELLNNKLCAPNRFYLSLQKGLPTIINKDNPTLYGLVEKYDCGYSIEDFSRSEFDELKKKQHKEVDQFEEIKKEQINSFTEIYKSFI
jgi:hypothetical protein